MKMKSVTQKESYTQKINYIFTTAMLGYLKI